MKPLRFLPLLLAIIWCEPAAVASARILQEARETHRAENRPMPPTPPLPVTALVAAGLSLVNAVALSLFVGSMRKRRKQEAERAQQQHRELSEQLGVLKLFVELRVAEVPPLAEKLDQVEERINGMAAAAEDLRAPSLPLGELKDELALLWRELASRGRPAPAGTDGAASARTTWLETEREALREAWQRFSEGSREVVAAAEAAVRDARWREIQADLQRLAQSVPVDLRPTCDATLAPAREFFNLASKLSLTARLASGELPSTGSEAKDLLRLRECATVLTMIQGSSLVAERLGFRLERWVAESFVGLADLILQRFQQAQQAGDTSAFEEGRGAALRFLKLADLLPVEIVLGRTPFDGAQHIGRSTACRPDVPNGVIVGVVRNGFVRGGQQVVRQPEVVVNRLG